MTMSKTSKSITFTAIISLTLVTTSSSVKAATFITYDSASISLQESILENIVITPINSPFNSSQPETGGSGIGNAGILTINSSNLTHDIVTNSQGQGGGILISEEPIVINTISSSSGTITLGSPSVSIEGGSISNAGEAIVINNNTFNNNSVPHSTAGGTITISTSSFIRVTTIPEPASPISFVILGMGGLLLRFNKFRQKKRV